MLTTTYATDPGDALLITRCLTSRPWSHVETPITPESIGAAMRTISYLPGPSAVRVSLLTWDALPKAAPVATVSPLVPAYAGIPVVIDNTLPPGTWKLVP